MTFGYKITEESVARSIITRAFDAGINFFDTADIYVKGQSEQTMGAILKDFPRHELVISSKVFWPMSDDVNDRGLSRKHIMESVDKSLRRIGTDYIDVYFCHRYDTDTPLDETAQAMDDLVRQGKVHYWGTSQWTGQQLNDVGRVCERLGLHRPQVEQPEYSLLARRLFERDMVPVAQAWGMGTVIWSPLGMGMLTGKYDQGLVEGTRMAEEEWIREGRFTEKNIQRVRDFKKHADDMGCSRAQLSLAWAAAQPGVSSVILGARSVEQFDENIKALDVNITPEVCTALDALFPVRPAWVPPATGG